MRWPFCSASVDSERGEHAGRQAEVEADAEDVAGADARPGEDEQLVLGERVAQLVDDRQDRVAAAVDDRAAADRDDLAATAAAG